MQEYWNGLPFPSPGDLPNPRIEPGSPALQTDTLPSEPLGKPENKDHGIWSHHFMGNRWGNSGKSVRLCFFGLQNPNGGHQMVTAAMKLKDAYSLEEKL